jgi:polyhydroxyalkanoate synthesis regulator phasin
MKKRTKKKNLKAADTREDPYLMRIGKGERLYKFYFFRPIAGQDRHFEYRIMTKEKTNGMLEMVSYNFKIVRGQPVKSGVMRAPELSKDQLESIVQNMVKKTNTEPDEFEELDLSRFSNIEEQIEFMKRQDRADSMTIS